ncbi:XRE family transcriptional regulator [Duganella sp. FT50W]|uniref:XRE family transcriptional regulator n=1 Tax=Duganella lactea TaxID=2692173 RepID=A0A6L8MEN8_9BURK|nr:XRE family transcriptional regulator [Duganella lactea]MYM81283.1 XRE family transcriptional regulator [Duganella lactea]
MIRIINSEPVEEGSENVYADLGFPDADEMLAKAMLTSQLDDKLNNLGMSHAQAAKMFDVPVSWLTDLLLGKFRDIARDQIVSCLDRLDSAVKRKRPAEPTMNS